MTATFTPHHGMTMTMAIAAAHDMAKAYGVDVRFEFNGKIYRITAKN